MTDQYVLTLSCPDKQGIVHAVSSYLFITGCNIEDSRRFGDRDTGLFFMRVHFSAEAPVTVDKLRASFAAVGDSFAMDWQIHRADERMRVVLMVSKFGHCLNDLLFRTRIGALPVDIVAVVSNHTDFAELVASYDVPFHHIPVTKDTKPEADGAAAGAGPVGERRARGAGPVHAGPVGRPVQAAQRPDHQHPPLVPAELQGRQAVPPGARARVKLIGATAHYVTADLDEGPIIEQEVERVGHEVTPDQLVAVGRDVECQALARAVKWHAEHRILLNGTRTVVFA